MLKKFKVKNFKKFKDELEFDFDNIKNYQFNTEVVDNGLVNVALVYGSNGSGKSNLGFAIFDIILHTTDTLKDINFYKNYLYGNGSLSRYAEFTYEFKFGNDSVVYRYIKEDYNKLVEEELIVNAEQMLYASRKDKMVLINVSEAKTLQIDYNIIEQNISILKYLMNNTIFGEDSVYIKLKEFLNSMLWFRSVESNNFMGYRVSNETIANIILGGENNGKEVDKEENLKNFEEFLREAGLSLKLKVKNIDGEDQIRLVVDAGNENERDIDFWDVASSGTKAFAVFYCWYKQLDNIKFVFIDEFDAFYHYKLSKFVIKKLKEKKGVQAILTTHSTNLMDNELLRPDAYFILKDNKIKSLPELTEKELRQAHNIEKMFKAGAFDE